GREAAHGFPLDARRLGARGISASERASLPDGHARPGVDGASAGIGRRHGDGGGNFWKDEGRGVGCPGQPARRGCGRSGADGLRRLSGARMTLPVRLGEDADFRTVREFLDSSAFTSEAVAERMGLARLYDIEHFELFDVEQREKNLAIQDALGTLVRLFLAGFALPDNEHFLPSGVLAAMLRLGLLHDDGGRLLAP